MKASPYDIRLLPWRQQIRDRYRLWFFPVTFGVFALTYGLVHSLLFPHASFLPLMGTCVGMLPSLWFGTPSRMSLVGASDREGIDAWMKARKHAFDPARGWVPNVPRALYFDSQIALYEGNAVIGPLVTLRKLRALLRVSSGLPV